MTDLEANPIPPVTRKRGILDFGLSLFAGACAVFAPVVIQFYVFVGLRELRQWLVDPVPWCRTGSSSCSAGDWIAWSLLMIQAVFAKYSVLTPRRLRKIASWCLDGQIAVWLVGFALNKDIIMVLLRFYDHWIRYR